MKSFILVAGIAAATLGLTNSASAQNRGHYHGGRNYGGHHHHHHNWNGGGRGGYYHNGHYHNHGYYGPRYYSNYGYYNAYPVQPYYAIPYGNNFYYNSPRFGIGVTW